MWLAIGLGAALLLGASDGPGAAGRGDTGPSGVEGPAGSSAPAVPAADQRIALPVDRAARAEPDITGRAEAPNVWSTPLRRELADEPETATPDPAAARTAAAGPAADLRFSLVSLTDLAPLRPAADLPAAGVPAAAAPSPDGSTAATASVSDPPAEPAEVPAEPGTAEPGTAEPGTAEPGTATPRVPAVRRAAAPPASRVAVPRILGKWAAEPEACQKRNATFLPLMVGPKGAKAGGASCRFGAMRPAGSSWAVAASCASGRERWTSNVTLTLVGNRLTWSSERGTQTYQRCG